MIAKDSYGNFLNRLELGRFPLQGSFELTRRCNLRCPYCYAGCDQAVSPGEELSRQEVFRILDQIAAAGCLFMTFTGGEPLLREDFPAIYRYALDRGLLALLFTNATLIDAEMAVFLKKYPPFYVDVTVAGATAEVYERVSGVKGSFRKAMEALRLLQRNGIPFRLKSVVSVLNRSEIGAMKALARKLGVRFRFDALISPRLDGSREPARFRLPPAEVVRLDHEDREKWHDFVEFSCRHWVRGSSPYLFRCGGGLHSFHVTSAGKLTMCIMDSRHQYDLRRGSFREGWGRFLSGVRRIKISRFNRCARCEIASVCGNCPAWSILETGSPDEPVEFRCQVARERCTLLNKEKEFRHGFETRKKKIPVP